MNITKITAVAGAAAAALGLAVSLGACGGNSAPAAPDGRHIQLTPFIWHAAPPFLGPQVLTPAGRAGFMIIRPGLGREYQLD